MYMLHIYFKIYLQVCPRVCPMFSKLGCIKQKVAAKTKFKLKRLVV